MREAIEPQIRAERVSKIYNRHLPDEVKAVDEVSLAVASGEVVALKGPSGSGKTSLLSLIGCMSRPTAGRVIVDRREVTKLPERFLTQVRRHTFGFIFQQLNLIRDQSVLDNVLLPLYPVALPLTEMKRRAEEILARLEISSKKSALKVRQLSGGEQQRVAIARALINRPAVVVADEPTANLDRGLARELLAILQQLNENGRTIVIATHDPLVYEHPFIGRVVEMRDGRIEGVTPP